MLSNDNHTQYNTNFHNKIKTIAEKIRKCKKNLKFAKKNALKMLPNKIRMNKYTFPCLKKFLPKKKICKAFIIRLIARVFC